MNIQSIETANVAVPLKKPFKTALRTVTVAESVYVKVICSDGTTGWGEAPPTHVITGDSLAGIKYAVEEVIAPALIGKSLLAIEDVFQTLDQCMVGNTSAKAAIDMAVYDCFSQHCGLPLYQLLGGYRNQLETDYTVSVNTPEEMAEDAVQYVEQGFSCLKVKVGKDDIETDIRRIQSIRSHVGDRILIRLDANQGWGAKEAVKAIRKMEDGGLDIELVEQPVKAGDTAGLKFVTDHVETPIMADESVFSPEDARKVLETRSADLINIKLMKAGGIHNGLKIAKLAASFGMECMIGSMIETKLGITAAAHLAASQPNITRFDFDAPLMLAQDAITGGIDYDGEIIRFPAETGLGIQLVNMTAESEEVQ
ncbi:mandelate racemase/muconate lactonizing enzyme family protein [Sediminibacillus halophilus]|uniref:Dipeptide epimerase n=1 Tax=Sediminibacillus halophilus TaxID=482461 RepID=A0A1G9U1U3_9BACI|nr:dipeptide epimerase [Sediminibacillus halophilus]SDM53831.1 o-succinylbenzoate synthase [Sediminibacillus halophilus]